MKENTDILADIEPLFGCPEKCETIGALLAAHSNLPGPRGNLTLAHAFADCFEYEGVRRELLDMLMGWTCISAEAAPVNDPREYLPFCGILALGAHYTYAGDDAKTAILDQFKIAMNDTRWRMREAVAMGFQRIAERDFGPIRDCFTAWYPDSTFLEKRAFIAALAHPPILRDPDIVRYSLRIGADILDDVMTVDIRRRRSEDFTALSKGLQYALSVFAAALPEEGFALLKKYAQADDTEIRKIIRSNIGKSRLTKKYPRMVDEVRRLVI